MPETLPARPDPRPSAEAGDLGEDAQLAFQVRALGPVQQPAHARAADLLQPCPYLLRRAAAGRTGDHLRCDQRSLDRLDLDEVAAVHLQVPDALVDLLDRCGVR